MVASAGEKCGLWGEKIMHFINSNSSYIYSLLNFSLFTLKSFVICMQNEIRIVFGINIILIGTL